LKSIKSLENKIVNELSRKGAKSIQLYHHQNINELEIFDIISKSSRIIRNEDSENINITITNIFINLHQSSISANIEKNNILFEKTLHNLNEILEKDPTNSQITQIFRDICPISKITTISVDFGILGYEKTKNNAQNDFNNNNNNNNNKHDTEQPIIEEKNQNKLN
jgi:hypothetical protein